MKKALLFTLALSCSLVGTVPTFAKGTGSGGGGGKICAAVCLDHDQEEMCISALEFERFQDTCDSSAGAPCWIETEQGSHVQVSECQDSKSLLK